MVIELTGSRSEIAFLPSLVDDPQQRQADITLARAELDWSPKTPLREGLSHTIAYFSELKR
jgi:UDP-glucuronate decarboxylase